MTVLTQLGVNQTVWIQLGYFFVAFFFVSQFLVKPYQANLAYRKKNTGGSLDEASKLAADTEQLISQFQAKLKAQNETTQAIYDKLKAEGQVEEDRLIAVARKQGSEAIEEMKKKISTELIAARESLKSQIPQISEMIASRVLGRDL